MGEKKERKKKKRIEKCGKLKNFFLKKMDGLKRKQRERERERERKSERE